MTEERFFERLREEARGLRYEPDDFVLARLNARVRERLIAPPSIAELLTAWFRPIAASLTAIALAATLGVTLIESAAGESATTIEAISASNTVEIAAGDDVYSLNN
jgi:hypothetical protein